MSFNETNENDEYIERALHSFKMKVMTTKQNIVEFKMNFNKM